MLLQINNEVSRLQAVVLGQPASLGATSSLTDIHDAKLFESVSLDIYTKEEDVFKEMTMFDRVLKKYNVQVFRPWMLDYCNQVFARDIRFVINDKIIVSNIILDRKDVKEAYENIYS